LSPRDIHHRGNHSLWQRTFEEMCSIGYDGQFFDDRQLPQTPHCASDFIGQAFKLYKQFQMMKMLPLLWLLLLLLLVLFGGICN